MKARNIFAQCAAGIVAGFLNLLLSSTAIRLHVPLFMDTLFTVTASCFGWAGGIIAAVASHIIGFLSDGYSFPKDIPNLLYFFCSLTIVAGVRMVLFRKPLNAARANPFDMLFLSIVLAFIISLEGGLFYVMLVQSNRVSANIIGNRAVSSLIYTFVTKNIPMLIASPLASIPVNLVDKTIAVFGGYGIFALLKKTLFQQKSQNESQTENSAAHDMMDEWMGGVKQKAQANSTKFDSLKTRNIPAQCAIGLAAGVLNLLFCSAAIALKLPLFMDTLFTVAASCFGWAGGIVAAVSFHVIKFAVHGQTSPQYLPNMVFFLCSLTVVICVRLMLFRKSAAGTSKVDPQNPLRLLILGIVLALAISFEGGIFYAAIIIRTSHILENHAVNMLLYPLMTQNVPMPASSTLISIPVNLVDKTLAVFGGYGVFAMLRRGMRKGKGEF
ncbi:MAG: hypothetical protein K2N31_02275 [Treponemataceae bacterium]|nr:hypothetical protein [Treponemataceae bacterium]